MENKDSFKTCELFGYFAIPYLGYYSDESYDVLEPEKIEPVKDVNIIKQFSPEMAKATSHFLQLYPETDIEIGQIFYKFSNINGQEKSNLFDWACHYYCYLGRKTNIILHFLNMQAKSDLKDESYHLKASVYTRNRYMSQGVTKFSVDSGIWDNIFFLKFLRNL